MKILAIDPGTTTGWAVGATEPVECGHQSFEAHARGSPWPIESRWLHFRRWLIIRCVQYKPTVIAVEKPLMQPRDLVVNGYATHARTLACELSYRLVLVHPSSARAYAGLKRGQGKAFMLRNALDRGWPAQTYDETDACWILACAAGQLSNSTKEAQSGTT